MAGERDVLAEALHEAYTLGWRDHEAGISPRQPDTERIRAVLAARRTGAPLDVDRLRVALRTLEYEFGLNIDLNPNLMRMWQLTARAALQPEGSARAKYGHILPLPEGVDPLTDRGYRRIEAHNEAIYQAMEATEGSARDGG